jgi:hypothetical protein
VSNSSSMSGFDQYSSFSLADSSASAFNMGSDQTSPEGSTCGDEVLIFPGRPAQPPTQVGVGAKAGEETTGWRQDQEWRKGMRADAENDHSISPSPLSLPSYAHLRDVGVDGQQRPRADSPSSSSPPSDQEGGSGPPSSSDLSDGGSSWRWIRRDGPSPSRGCFSSASDTPDTVSSDSDSCQTDHHPHPLRSAERL